jgi:hypothetical protein
MPGAWWRWLGVGFFGFGVIVSAVMLLPGPAYLRVTPVGFTVRSLLSSCSCRWNDIDRFHVAGLGRIRFVAVDFAPDFDRHRISRKVLAALFEHEGALPDTYGMKCEELAEFLNQYKERARAL